MSLINRLVDAVSGKEKTQDRTPPNFKRRHVIAQDTIKRSAGIVSEHKKDGASTESVFLKDPDFSMELQAAVSSGDLKCPGYEPRPVEVVNSDSYVAARKILEEFPEESKGKVTVLNLASDEHPGDTNVHTALLQEEALCYSSTLYGTLKESYYPWPNLGPGSVAGVYSPGIVIFKDELDQGCVDLEKEERRVVSVITVAAPRGPKLTEDGQSFAKKEDLEDLRGKIRLVYRMAVKYGQHYLVSGAMGCGAYRCPPKLVAEEMKSILLEPEFKGWFSRVVFAVYSTAENGGGNFGVFKQVFEGVQV